MNEMFFLRIVSADGSVDETELVDSEDDARSLGWQASAFVSGEVVEVIGWRDGAERVVERFRMQETADVLAERWEAIRDEVLA